MLLVSLCALALAAAAVRLRRRGAAAASATPAAVVTAVSALAKPAENAVRPVDECLPEACPTTPAPRHDDAAPASAVVALGGALGDAAGAACSECGACAAVDAVALAAALARRTGAALRQCGVVEALADGGAPPGLSAADGRAFVDAFCCAFQRACAAPLSDAVVPAEESCSSDALQLACRSAQAGASAQLATMSSPAASDAAISSLGSPLQAALMELHAHDLWLRRESNALKAERLREKRSRREEEGAAAAARALRGHAADSLACGALTASCALARRALRGPQLAARLAQCAPAGWATSMLRGPTGAAACAATVFASVAQSYALLAAALYLAVLRSMAPSASSGAPLTMLLLLLAGAGGYGGGAVVAGLGGDAAMWHALCGPFALAHLCAQVEAPRLAPWLAQVAAWQKWVLWLAVGALLPLMLAELPFLWTWL